MDLLLSSIAGSDLLMRHAFTSTTSVGRNLTLHNLINFVLHSHLGVHLINLALQLIWQLVHIHSLLGAFTLLMACSDQAAWW